MQNSSSNGKIIGIIIVVGIIIAGVWLMTRKTNAPVATVPETTATASTVTTPAEPVDPAVAAIQTSSTSNSTLDANSAAIDAELQGFHADNVTAQSAQ